MSQLASKNKPGVARAAQWAVGLVVLVQLAAAFVALDGSSFWIDELYSAWAVAPADWDDAWTRITADVHPPLYYLSLRLWSSLFGASDVALRAFSAACAGLAVAVIVLGPRRHLSLDARLLAALVAVCSNVWFDQSQNARMYALGLLAFSIVLVVALDLAARGRQDALRPGDHLALLAAGLLAAFTHFYLLVAVGAVYGVLVLLVRRLADRGMLAVGGLIVLACLVAYLKVMLPRSMMDIHDLWFENSWRLFAHDISRGLRDQFGLGVLVLVVVALGMVAVRARGLWAEPSGRTAMGQAALLLVPPMVLIVVGVAVSLLVAPSFSARNVAAAAPAAWLAVGALYDLVAASFGPRRRSLAFVLVALAAGLGAREALNHGRPFREEWRNSGAFISSLPACEGKAIPVLDAFPGRDTALTWSSAEFAYGRYLTPEGGHRLVMVRNVGEMTYVYPQAAIDLMRARLEGRDPCPVLLWAVHGMPVEAAMIAAVAGETGVDPARIAVRRFAHEMPANRAPVVSARVLVVAAP